MSNEPISDRLAYILSELTSLPKEEAYAAISEAVSEAYIDVGCGGSRPHIARLMTEAAMCAARTCQYDMEELSHFYKQEARFDGSDHSSEDCTEWSIGYSTAASIMEKAADSIEKVSKGLDKNESRLDI